MELNHIKVASVCYSLLNSFHTVFEDRKEATDLLFAIACRPDPVAPKSGDVIVRIASTASGNEEYATLNRGEYEEICEYLKKGQKINAIKILRNACGCGLKEAKDTVEMNWNFRL